MLKVKDVAHCPCESGKAPKECCLTPDGKLRPKPVLIRTIGLKTGYQNPKCYAADLSDCSKEMSGEHYISHGVLKLLSRNGNVEVDGFPWQQKGNWKKVPSKKLTSNILCCRHNSALSPLDSIAIRFLENVEKIDSAILSEKENDLSNIYLFNGFDIERWMLKTVCGVIYSGNASMNQKVISWKPPSHWLPILFDNEPFLAQTGMHFAGRINVEEQNKKEFEFTPLTNNESIVDGAKIKLKYFRFILAMTPTDENSHAIFSGSTFRPSEFIINGEKSKHAIFIWWDQPGDQKSVEIRYNL